MTHSPPASRPVPLRQGPLGLEGPVPLLAACLIGAFTSSSYNTMVNVALPEIGQVFVADLTVVQWVVLIYLLTTSSTIVISGRIGDLFGARRLYKLGLAVFALGGLACAAAPALPVLLAARPLQAIGASMFVVSVPAILTEVFPDRQRGRVMGFYSTAVFVGLSTGPLLGGVLTQVFGWRSVFLGSVLVALTSLYLAWRFVPADQRRRAGGGFDLAGSLAYVGTLVPLLLALSRAQQWGLTAAPVLGLVALGLISGAVLVAVERRAAAPVLDLSLLTGRYFGLSALASFTMFIAYYPVVFLMPFYLVQARGIPPGLAGLLLGSLPVAMAAVAAPAGLLCDRLGAAVPATLGAALIGTSLLLLAQLGPDTSYLFIILSVAVVGAGAGFGDVANNTAMMGAVPPSRRGMASGVVGTTRYVGQSTGVALASAIFAAAAGVEVGPSSMGGFTAAFLSLTAVAGLSAVASLARGRMPQHHDSRASPG